MNGRLDRGEYDDRTTALFATRTLGELPELVADLVRTASSTGASAVPALRVSLTRRELVENEVRRLHRAQEKTLGPPVAGPDGPDCPDGAGGDS